MLKIEITTANTFKNPFFCRVNKNVSIIAVHKKSVISYSVGDCFKR